VRASCDPPLFQKRREAASTHAPPLADFPLEFIPNAAIGFRAKRARAFGSAGILPAKIMRTIRRARFAGKMPALP
jgi:hypothetical protein